MRPYGNIGKDMLRHVVDVDEGDDERRRWESVLWAPQQEWGDIEDITI